MSIGVIYVGASLVLGAICAGLGQTLTGYSRGGCPVSFIVAFAGTVIGPWVATRLELPEPLWIPLGQLQYPISSAAAGALILVIIVNLLTRKRKF
jgi:uncharacterized membrane protein YeaQ/YmgE (transglycosylase-associated protein family)